MRKNRSELVKISIALKYEIKMLIETARILYNYNMDGGDYNQHRIIKNALVEAFTLHARILLDFLYSGQQRHDAVAIDFFDDRDQWRKKRPKRSKELKDVQYRVGKEIAHLTYERLKVKPSEKAWSLSIAKEVYDRVILFRGLVPIDRVDQEFLQYIDNFEGFVF